MKRRKPTDGERTSPRSIGMRPSELAKAMKFVEQDGCDNLTAWFILILGLREEIDDSIYKGQSITNIIRDMTMKPLKKE